MKHPKSQKTKRTGTKKIFVASEKREAIDLILIKAEYDTSLTTIDPKVKAAIEKKLKNKDLTRKEAKELRDKADPVKRAYFRKPIKAKKGQNGEWLKLRFKVVNPATERHIIRTAKFMFREADIQEAEELVKCRFEYWNASHLAHANELMARVNKIRKDGKKLTKEEKKEYNQFTNRRMREKHADRTCQAHPGSHDTLRIKKDDHFDMAWHDQKINKAKEETKHKLDLQKRRRRYAEKKSGKPVEVMNYSQHLASTMLVFEDRYTDNTEEA